MQVEQKVTNCIYMQKRGVELRAVVLMFVES